MCQMLSPERALIWSLLHDPDQFRAVGEAVRAEHFTHIPYARWFEISRHRVTAGLPVDMKALTEAVEAAWGTISPSDRRALRRMFRVAPPRRIRTNPGLLAKACRIKNSVTVRFIDLSPHLTIWRN